MRPCESPPEKIKNSITTSDRAVQCEFLTHQPVELNAKSEGLIYKNGGCYSRKSPERSIKTLTPLDDDLLTSYIEVTIDNANPKHNSIESRRLDDPMPRRQSSRNRRPPKRFRSSPPSKPAKKSAKSKGLISDFIPKKFHSHQKILEIFSKILTF